LFSALALPIFAQAESFSLFLIAAVPLAIGSALISPSVASLVSKHAPQDRLGETFGVNQGLSSLARVIGPFSGLTAFSLWSPLPFLIGAVLYALLFVYLGLILQQFSATPVKQEVEA
jgi:MFS family permease